MAKNTSSGLNNNDALFGEQTTTVKSGIQMDDFAKMFEDSTGQSGHLRVGDSFKGEILAINKDEAFVSTSTTKDAVIMVSELLNEDKTFKYKKGDTIDVTVYAIKGGEIRVSRTGSKKAQAGMDSLEDAHDMELPVEGRVLEKCNGGFRVQIEGKTAFCPVSQMDFKVVDQDSYVGKKFEFLITQYDPKGRNLVVSRRKVLDLQKAENEGEFMQKAKVDEIVNGEVTRMEKFGAFVRMDGGVEGLVHISEIGWSRLADPSEVLSLGQKVQAKILKIDDIDGRLKISLSIKQAGGEGDPWMQVPQNYPIGSQWDGVVEKKENYGLFVNIAPGITGLLPRSKWRESMDPSQYENKKKGDKIKIQIDEILFEQKRISMGLPVDAEDNSWRSHTTGTTAKAGFANSSFSGLGDLLKKK